MAKIEIQFVDGKSGHVSANRCTQEPDGFVTFWRGEQKVHRIERGRIAHLHLNTEPGKRLYMFGMLVMLPVGVISVVGGLLTGFIWGFWALLWVGLLMAVLGLAIPFLSMAAVSARTSGAAQSGMAAYFTANPGTQPGTPEANRRLAQLVNEGSGITEITLAN